MKKILLLTILVALLCSTAFGFAQPKLSDATCNVQTSDGGTATVTVSNTGDARGNYGVSLICEDEKVIGLPQSISLEAGKSTSVTLEAFGGTTKIKETVTCSLQATDSLTVETSKISVDCEVYGNPLNKQGLENCLNNRAEVFQETGWKVVRDCSIEDEKCKMINDQAVCIPDSFNYGTFSSVEAIVYGIVMIVIFVLIPIILIKNLVKKRDKK